MALPTPAYLQSLLPAQQATMDPAALVRRLSSLIPGALITVSATGVTASAGFQSVSVPLPQGVTLGAPVVAPRSIANANAPVHQNGDWPADAQN